MCIIYNCVDRSFTNNSPIIHTVWIRITCLVYTEDRPTSINIRPFWLSTCPIVYHLPRFNTTHYSSFTWSPHTFIFPGWIYLLGTSGGSPTVNSTLEFLLFSGLGYSDFSHDIRLSGSLLSRNYKFLDVPSVNQSYRLSSYLPFDPGISYPGTSDTTS